MYGVPPVTGVVGGDSVQIEVDTGHAIRTVGTALVGMAVGILIAKQAVDQHFRLDRRPVCLRQDEMLRIGVERVECVAAVETQLEEDVEERIKGAARARAIARNGHSADTGKRRRLPHANHRVDGTDQRQRYHLDRDGAIRPTRVQAQCAVALAVHDGVGRLGADGEGTTCGPWHLPCSPS